MSERIDRTLPPQGYCVLEKFSEVPDFFGELELRNLGWRFLHRVESKVKFCALFHDTEADAIAAAWAHHDSQPGKRK